jgi:ribonuclease T
MPSEPTHKEVYISVDIETAGPNPHDYSLLTIGAVAIEEMAQMFYIELQPLNSRFRPEALEISRLSMQHLEKHGAPPKDAMAQFEMWINAQATGGKLPVFVAFNAAFDWMFVNDYFHRFLGRNPFGHTALDIKSFYMGLWGVQWQETSMRFVGPRYLGDHHLTHHALRDAMDQAEIFRKMLAEAPMPRKE